MSSPLFRLFCFCSGSLKPAATSRNKSFHEMLHHFTLMSQPGNSYKKTIHMRKALQKFTNNKTQQLMHDKWNKMEQNQ